MVQAAFIINPFSAGGKYQGFIKKLETLWENPLIYISDSIQGTARFIEETKQTVQVYVAVGGDGTISTVARHLVHTDKVLAIFPAGSGNGFSNETNFTTDLKSLLSRIQEFKTHRMDTFTVNGRLSINVSGVGFDGSVVRRFERTERGFINYIKVALKTFFVYRPVRIEFLDSKYSDCNGKYLMLNLANTRQFGNHAYIAPHASSTDGLVDVVLVKKFPTFYSALFTYRMFTRTLRQDKYVRYLSVSKIRFKVNSSKWHIDGEYQSIKSPVEVEVQPKSLRVLS